MCFPTFAGALFSSSSDESLSSLLLDPALADAAAATLADAAATLADADATLAGTALGATKHKALELGCKKKQKKKNTQCYYQQQLLWLVLQLVLPRC